jgi:SAM-dependent methyltransferase
LRLSSCGSCGLIQLATPRTSAAVIGHGHGTASSTSLSEHERSWAAQLGSFRRSGAFARIVDVACGDGTLLAAVGELSRTSQAELVGFEADPVKAAMARARGIHVIEGPFDAVQARSMARQGQVADLVVVNQELAHTDDPGELVDAIRSITAPGGMLALEAHHALGLVRDGQFDVVSHAHATYPMMADLMRLLGNAGFSIVAADLVAAYGGSIRLLALPDGSPTSTDGDSAVGKVLELEMAAMARGHRQLRDVGLAARRTATALRDHLEARRAEGRVVVGYGAPARANVLLSLAGIDVRLLPFTVDRNAAKQGLVMAGTRIPVREPAALEAAAPDEVLVLAWTLADEIAGQLAPLRARGTRLVVAMPALRVLPS